MELQQRFSVSANEYEKSEGVQRSDATEDVYQCLNQPPTAADQCNKNTALISEQSWQKFVVLLFAVNILILMIILAITGMNYSLNKEAHLIQVANGQSANNQEGWLLHDNVFYLFWRDHSDCDTAIRFCKQRNASLVNITRGNEEEESEDKDDQCGILTPGINKEQTEGFVCGKEAKIN